MNIHHFFFAVGSLSGPLIVGAALAGGITWQDAYRFYGLAALLLSSILFLPGIPPVRSDRPFDRRGMGILLRDPAFLTLFAITFLSVGVQNGIAYWLVTFLKDAKGYSIGIASTSLSLFFVCLAIGRLLTSYLITRFQETVYLLSLVLARPHHPRLRHRPSRTRGRSRSSGCAGWRRLASFRHCSGGPAASTPTPRGRPWGSLPPARALGSMVIAWLISLVAQLAGLHAGFAFLELASCSVSG